jgi:hypothetical protein
VGGGGVWVVWLLASPPPPPRPHVPELLGSVGGAGLGGHDIQLTTEPSTISFGVLKSS